MMEHDRYRLKSAAALCVHGSVRTAGNVALRLLGVSLLFWVFLAGNVFGQTDQRGPDANEAGGEKPSLAPQRIAMNFNDVDIGILIKFISDLTGKNFVVDPAVKAKVTIISPEKITIDEAYRVFLSVLDVNDFTAVEAGKVIKIVKAADAKAKGVATHFKKEVKEPEDKIITQIQPLRYAEASELARMLKPLVPTTGVLMPYTETNTLIIIDVESNIDRLVGIVRELDHPGYSVIEVFTLENARAEQLGPKLVELLGKGQDKQTTKETVKMIGYDRTNSLIVSAPPSTMDEVRRLIEQLDREEVKPKTSIYIYRLQNSLAENLVKVLSEIPGKGAKEKKGEAPTAPLISKDVQITADRATNSIVIIAGKEEYATLESVIKQLDVPRTMVYVEAAIMEVSADKSLQLGVQWRIGGEFGGGFEVGSNGGVAIAQTPGVGDLESAIAQGQLPTGLAVGVVGNAIKLGEFTFASIAAFVRAVRNDSDFNVISTPQILTLDNEEALIEAGQNVPFVTRTDQGTAVTDRLIQSFDYKDVGVTLRVTPQINSQRTVRLTVEQSVKNVIESTALDGTVLAPTTSYRTTKSTITVKDGETAVIGGLKQSIQNRGRAITPCLGDIPLVGWLFKQINDKDQDTNLFVFLTPHIIDNPDEQRAIYEREKGAYEEMHQKAIRKSQPETLRQKAFQ
jgi:general secretion pathway protein D